MDFKLQRDKDKTADSQLGELIGSNSLVFQCLERLFDGVPKIPAGVYKCVRFMSPHLGYEVFMLVDVPGHDHILIHIGNTWVDLDGCIAVGQRRGVDSILDSRHAFEAFMMIQKDVQEFTLTVED